MGEEVSLGIEYYIEYYNEKGSWRRFDTGNDQGKTLNRVCGGKQGAALPCRR